MIMREECSLSDMSYEDIHELVYGSDLVSLTSNSGNY